MAQYIDKSAVIAEIKKKLDKYNKLQSFNYGAVKDLESLLNFLNTLEVKEVDLKKEIEEEYLQRRRYGGRDNMLVVLNHLQFENLAKHFFELGMQVSNKVQKGIKL